MRITLFSLLFALLCLLPQPVNALGSVPVSTSPQRLVSLAPSITECLFACGAGDRVVGVTRYCNWPTETQELPRVGGYLDLSIESVVRLQPDLVLLLREGADAAQSLRAMGIRCLLLQHDTLAGLLSSLDSLQLYLGGETRADSLKQALQTQLDHVQQLCAPFPVIRTALCVGRDPAPGLPRDLYMTGGGSYLSELLTLAGGENVYAGSLPAVPQVDRESLYHLQPEVIFELVPENGARSEESLREDWLLLQGIVAVTQGHVFVLSDPVLTIPGPRLGQALCELALCLHPELKRETLCP